MTDQYDSLIERAVKIHLPDTDWRLYKAQLMAESNLNIHAVSPAGAEGIAQFMPATWKEVAEELRFIAGITPFNPDYAILAGAYYMRKMKNGWTAPRPEIDRYCLALASYNAGLGNLYKAQKAANGANDYATIMSALPSITGRNSTETIEYVKRILSHFNDLVTDKV